MLKTANFVLENFGNALITGSISLPDKHGMFRSSIIRSGILSVQAGICLIASSPVANALNITSGYSAAMASLSNSRSSESSSIYQYLAGNKTESFGGMSKVLNS